MINIEDILVLSDRSSVAELEASKSIISSLDVSNSELLDIADDMFRVGSKSHLSSLNPLVREDLGIQLEHMTRADPKLQLNYQTLKNKYISLGKSFSSISFLFDLVSQDFTLLDVLLMHELLMDDGSFRTTNVSIKYNDGTELVIPAVAIAAKIGDLFQWYYGLKENNLVPKIVVAALFHYYFVVIHPFNDGNGRISRIFLNLILLKDGLFPIVIPDNRRRDYYQSLIDADSGDFSSLIDLIADLEKEKTHEYLKLARDLSALESDINCLVLTEDGNTGMIESLLEFHNFDLNKTAIESYDGKDNIASAVFLARKMKEKSSAVKHIIFHRDRDNEQPQQLKQIITKFIKGHGLLDCSTVFITKFYDMESYFVNEYHVSEVFPQISIARAKKLIELATIETSDVSKKKLRIALFEYGRYGKIADPEERTHEINELYELDPEKHRYGKAVLFRLEELITQEIKSAEQVSLVKKSHNVKIKEFENVNTLLN
jgi:fido (protein-threonine AMPylation protein)